MADEHLISLQPGTVIAGRYEVVKCLGAGSMGLVYACRHRELSGHMVAVKVLFPEVAQDKIAAARFRNEIFASYGVSHPNVVRAYEYLRDGDLVAYTMEYVGGGDLADRLGRTGEPMSVAEVVRLLGQMCAGVQAIHDAGIIHRDLKPENILLTKEGNVKIADFGIARTGHGPKLTEHGGVVGTIDYVSPEYMLNSQVDWRSDIYAIGILGYEMMTGESPFRGDSVYATMTKRLKSDAAPPSSHRADCPKELDAIILRAMHRNPEERYQSAVDMYNDLRAIAQNIPGYNSGSQTIPSMSKSALKIDPVVVEGGAAAGGLQINAVSKQSPAFSRSGPSVPVAEKNGVAHAISAGDEEPSLAERYSGRYSAKSKPQAPESVGDAAESTQVLNPEISRIASQFDEDQTINEPIRMERVLAYNDLVSEGNWSSGGASGEVNPSAGRINEERLQRLSQQTIYKGRSLWIDMCTVVAAIVIGVGIGYLVLRVFFPDLVRRSHNNAPAVIIQER